MKGAFQTLSWLALGMAGVATCTNPVAQTKNGSYYGVYMPQYKEDYFLGIPFAKPPLAHLRWANPESVNESWSGLRPATGYAMVRTWTDLALCVFQDYILTYSTGDRSA